nr:tRNA lysidine(34) synthetase TilS [Ruminococcus sp.]
MIEKIRAFTEKYGMINSGDTVVCGLSGGADSVCLLLALRRLSEDMGFSVEAAHINHCLRGEESDRDEKFCRKLCLRLNIPFTAAVCDVRSHAESESVSLEQAARDMRYQALQKIAYGKKIATAHNADDNLETILLNLVRGSGIKGLSGIPPVRGNIIRPLLTVSRSEIEEYLSSAGQDYVTDSTNLTDDYTRNKIRHNIIPVLKTINSSLADTTARTAEVLRSENNLIESETDAAYKKCLRGNSLYNIAEFPEVIRRRCIARLLGTNISCKRLAECDNIAVNGGKLNISGDMYFISDGVSAELRHISRPESSGITEKPLELGINSIFPGINLVCDIIV